MTITQIGTERRRMRKIVIHNDTIYLCGQVAKDSTADIREQTRTMLEKVDNLLIEAGSDRKHILSATIYIKNMKDFSAMNGLLKAILRRVLVLKPVWRVLNYWLKFRLSQQ